VFDLKEKRRWRGEKLFGVDREWGFRDLLQFWRRELYFWKWRFLKDGD
jgi:hypothetical protein